MTRKLTVVCLMTLAFGWMVETVSAQLVVNPAGKADIAIYEGGALFSLGEVDYETDDGDYTVERSELGVYMAYGLDERFDLYGALSFSLKAELDADLEGTSWDDEGDGYRATAGTRLRITENDPYNVFAYAQISYLSEDYGRTTGALRGVPVAWSVEADLIELTVGVGADYIVDDEFTVYGALELVPFSDGEADISVSASVPGISVGASTTEDIERADIIGIRCGGLYRLDTWFVRGELGLASEQTFNIGAGRAF